MCALFVLCSFPKAVPEAAHEVVLEAVPNAVCVPEADHDVVPEAVREAVPEAAPEAVEFLVQITHRSFPRHHEHRLQFVLALRLVQRLQCPQTS